MKPYRLGAPNHRGEWSVLDPSRKPGDQVIGYAVLSLVDTHITGIQPGEAYEVGDAEIVWTKDDTERFDDPDDFDWTR